MGKFLCRLMWSVRLSLRLNDLSQSSQLHLNGFSSNNSIIIITIIIYVSLRLRVQNRRKKWNFPLNFRTMHKLSDLYSGIFQTQSSGCASGVDLFRNFTKLKILNI